MKKWSVIIAALMALLVLALSPMSALAQNDEEVMASSQSLLRGSLAVVAPRIALVGKEVSMTVFLRANQEPFEGAGVWALTRDKAEVLKEEMAALRKDSSLTAEEKDYEALVSVHGTFLGRTGEDGKLYHTFEEAGGYILVAVKRGYFPGFTAINVRDMPRALAIEAPGRAPVGEGVTMSVFQRGTQEPVGNAGIWALTRDEVGVLKEEMVAFREDSSLAAEEKDYEALISVHGTFLGRTNEGGQLTHIFEEAGGYLLVTVKKGYIPGFTPIGIGNMSRALAIAAPGGAMVGEGVTMFVFQRGTQELVGDAGVWALTRDKVEVLKEEMVAFREDSSLAAEEKDYESLISVHGTFLGRTNEGGQLTHTFIEAGGYLLVTVKKGYVPGFTPIGIRNVPEPAPVLEQLAAE